MSRRRRGRSRPYCFVLTGSSTDLEVEQERDLTITGTTSLDRALSQSPSVEHGSMPANLHERYGGVKNSEWSLPLGVVKVRKVGRNAAFTLCLSVRKYHFSCRARRVSQTVPGANLHYGTRGDCTEPCLTGTVPDTQGPCPKPCLIPPITMIDSTSGHGSGQSGCVPFCARPGKVWNRHGLGQARFGTQQHLNNTEFELIIGVNGYLTSVGESRIEVTLWRRMAATQTHATCLCGSATNGSLSLGQELQAPSIQARSNDIKDDFSLKLSTETHGAEVKDTRPHSM
ncbi:hypothetical protein Bbelb_019900 [Branchiostoma belcheri]|nr:hypothetical protein Bbelb_019900 [Branchiostoma belcheri]